MVSKCMVCVRNVLTLLVSLVVPAANYIRFDPKKDYAGLYVISVNPQSSPQSTVGIFTSACSFAGRNLHGNTENILSRQ